MDTRQAYNIWAEQYDTNQNKTRDAEGIMLHRLLGDMPFATCLELGCGTGKNTAWLISKAAQVTSVDFSEEMLAKARQKTVSDKVSFVQGDLTAQWVFATGLYDLVTFSLVLEHIEDLQPVLQKTAAALNPGGYVYIGELHPFRQYTGSKARFDTAEGRHIVPCFTHHVSDFTTPAREYGLALIKLEESFDDDDRTLPPRILGMLFQKR